MWRNTGWLVLFFLKPLRVFRPACFSPHFYLCWKASIRLSDRTMLTFTLLCFGLVSEIKRTLHKLQSDIVLTGTPKKVNLWWMRRPVCCFCFFYVKTIWLGLTSFFKFRCDLWFVFESIPFTLLRSKWMLINQK